MTTLPTVDVQIEALSLMTREVLALINKLGRHDQPRHELIECLRAEKAALIARRDELLQSIL